VRGRRALPARRRRRGRQPPAPAAIEEMLELLTTEAVTHSRPRRRLPRKRR